ncbi:HAD family hydrolase [Plebeiibacterium marinum]|uniref:phosphoglycolate phosphatase n=1 Tax=Plebeiibacterium marinum TaxID=2992111 RepID=A0AAE3MF66_9BACT|nr:HAD family hydrolase [Plebeiobacterium marinum]MCW3806853.1 HAD family hydrolase [Plebeiobacterium marinum]
MGIKAVIFDLDGTLLDSIQDIADANNQMLSEYDYPLHELSAYVKWIGNGARRLVEASLPPNLRGGDSVPYIDKYQDCYKNNISNKSKIFEGMDRVLDYLTDKNIPMAIITNKPQNLTDIIVKKYFKNWSFKNVIGHSNAFPHKPNPKGALHFAKQINCDPKDILLVGDSVVDIQTAKAANMLPLGVSWGYGKPGAEDRCTVVVDQAQEIIDYIKIN